MIYLIRNKPISDPEISNFAMFDNAHGAALFMWGKAVDEWSFALTEQSYRPMIELCKDSLISTIEKELNKLIDQRNHGFAVPTNRDRDNAFNAWMDKQQSWIGGLDAKIINKCLKTRDDIVKFITLCNRKDSKVDMGAIPSGDPNTYEITIHDGTKIIAEWRHHDIPA